MQTIETVRKRERGRVNLHNGKKKIVFHGIIKKTHNSFRDWETDLQNQKLIIWLLLSKENNSLMTEVPII